uniref:Uncharacterized protein n=1 Tax=Oryza sativa subsp. japonica TaxID=39947 RepID=Q2R4V0_ORYSJ|nr:hypothetical protein LOC_Os11g27220 [Oryza sativa Japonica Group]
MCVQTTTAVEEADGWHITNRPLVRWRDKLTTPRDSPARDAAQRRRCRPSMLFSPFSRSLGFGRNARSSGFGCTDGAWAMDRRGKVLVKIIPTTMTGTLVARRRGDMRAWRRENVPEGGSMAMAILALCPLT